MDDGVDDGYLPMIRKVVNALHQRRAGDMVRGGAASCWSISRRRPHKPADMLCERLFTERCQIKHPDLNLVHDEKWQKSSNTPLKQAVMELLDNSSPVQIDNGNPDNHGEKRYLQKVLLNGCGALSRLRSAGTVTRIRGGERSGQGGSEVSRAEKVDCQADGAEARRISRSRGLHPRDAQSTCRRRRTMLVLALAHAVRAFGERLRVFRDSTHTEAGYLMSFEAIVQAVADPAAKLELSVREISASQRTFIESVAKAVGAETLAHGETRR